MIKSKYMLVICSFIWASTSVAARAESDVECSKYAEKTVEQHAQNLKFGCGYSGLRWHNNKIGHFVFCKASDKNTINAEIEVRAVLLQQCSPDVAEDPEPQAEDQQEQEPQAENQPEQEPQEENQQEQELQAEDQSEGEEEDTEDETIELEQNDLPDDDVPDDEGAIDEG